MTNDSDSLLREVDDELRRDQLEKLWKRYNGVILGAAFLIVASVWGYKFMEGRRIAAAEAAGSEYATALKFDSDKKPDDASKAFAAIAAAGPKGYAALAKLHIAGDDLKAGKKAEALAAYEALANDSSSDDLLKSFAQLQAASVRMGDADFTELQNRLTPLSGDSSPFKISAREMLGIAAYKAGKYDEARKYLEPLLIDPNAARGIQERVKIVMAGIAQAELAKAAPDVEAKPAEVKPAEAKTAPVAEPETKAEPQTNAAPDKK